MAFTPVSNIVPQFSKNASGASASGYYLKFYADGTTTPISMATDSTGGTLLAKCELDSLGYPTTDGTNIFIPHIDQTYKLALYENATDADNNTLASAAWVVDDLEPVISGQISDLVTKAELIATNGTSLITHTNDGTDYNLATYLQNRHVVTPKDFAGANDAEKIQAAINFCEVNQEYSLTLEGEYDCGTVGLVATEPFTILANAIITWDYAFDGVALALGESDSNLTTTANPRKMNLLGNLSLIKTRNGSNQPRWWVDTDNSEGFQLWNASECAFDNITVDGFGDNVVLISDTTAGCVRNIFKRLYSTNGRSNFKAHIQNNPTSLTDVGYVNENAIFGGTLGNSTSTPAGVQSSIVSCDLNVGSKNFKPNGNNFYNMTMENSVADINIDINGFQNSFRECRMESVKAGSVKLRSGAYDNIFDSNFGAGFAQAAFDDQSDNTTIYSGLNTQYFYSSSAAAGVYTGRNMTLATDGGKAGYPIFVTFHHESSTMSAAVSETGLYAFNATNNDYPTFFADGENKKTWFGSGFFPAGDGSSVRASTDKMTLLWESAEATNGYSANRMSGGWESPHQWVNNAGTIFYEWIDASGNKRGKRSAPISDTDGTITSAAAIP